MMKTLDRYIARNFLQALVIWMLAILALRIVADLSFNMDEFAETREKFDGYGGVIRHILWYYGHHALVYFAELGGVTVMAAAAFAIYRMNTSNELTAMMASGVSLHRVLRPIIIYSLAVSALVMIDRELIISDPQVRTALSLDKDDPDGGKGMSVMMLTDGRESVWYSRRYTPEQQRMDQPLVVIRDNDLQTIGRISGANAVAGKMAGMEGWFITSTERLPATLSSLDGPSGHGYPPASTRLIWTSVSAGRMREQVETSERANDGDQQMVIQAAGVEGPQGRAELINPQFTFARVDGSTLAIFTADKAVQGPLQGQLTPWRLEGSRLFFPSDLRPTDIPLRQTSQWLDYMSISELTNLLRLDKITDARAAVMAKHVRITEPLNNLVMLLVGVPFILSRERNVKASALRCVLMVIAFYAFLYLARYIGLPPIWAAWLPVLVFGPVAALMLDAVKT